MSLPSYTTVDTLATFQKDIEAKLKELTSFDARIPESNLWEAAQYSLFTPGKRLRPLLLLSTAFSFGVTTEKALLPACALEFIHTYSLIHDDLPCMDDDDFRRGQPSLHKRFDEATAVLTGDFLLTYAFDVLASSPLDSKMQVKLVQTLAKASGGHGMIGGQMLDIISESRSIDLDFLYRIHLGKTASLIQASVEMGAIIANVDPVTYIHLQAFGRNIGLAFQMNDDIQDAEESVEKTTAVSLLGLEGARERRNAYYNTALHHLKAISTPLELLEFLAEKMTFKS